MNYLDTKYLTLISSRLENFNHVRDNLYNFRCPFCGDSKIKKSKARGYVFGDSNVSVYYCHNCGKNCSFEHFLEEIDNVLYNEYKLEKLKEKLGGTIQKNYSENIENKFVSNMKFNNPLVFCKKLIDDDSEVKKYALKRKIPFKFWNDLYAIDDVNKVSCRIDKYSKTEFPNKPALVIPFYDKNDKYNFILCRLINEDKFRYVNLQINDEKSPKFWGEKYIDWNKMIYMLEGPIDAMFVENSIAISGAAIGSEYIINQIKERNLSLSNLVMTFDNDFKYNKNIMKLVRKSIEKGFSVVLYDHRFDNFKDINEAITKGNWSIDDINTYLKERTFSGAKAMLEFSFLIKRKII